MRRVPIVAQSLGILRHIHIKSSESLVIGGTIMRLMWIRRRWRWLLTLVLLIWIGVIGFVIIHTPPAIAGHLLIERQQTHSDLFDEYDVVSQQLQAITFNNTDDLINAREMNLAQDGKRLVFVASQRGGGHIYMADYPFVEVQSISAGTNDFQP